MTQFFSAVFRVAWFLAAIGGLRDATLFMLKEAAHTQQRGLISLTRVNRMFWGDVAHRAQHR